MESNRWQILKESSGGVVKLHFQSIYTTYIEVFSEVDFQMHPTVSLYKVSGATDDSKRDRI